MSSQFDRETEVESVGEGQFTAQVSGSWNIGDNPNGGYLTAIALQALRQTGPHQDPVSVTTHFLRPGSGGQDAETVSYTHLTLPTICSV